MRKKVSCKNLFALKNELSLVRYCYVIDCWFVKGVESVISIDCAAASSAELFSSLSSCFISSGKSCTVFSVIAPLSGGVGAAALLRSNVDWVGGVMGRNGVLAWLGLNRLWVCTILLQNLSYCKFPCQSQQSSSRRTQPSSHLCRAAIII